MKRCAATPESFAAHLTMWRDMLRRTDGIESVCELGASYGMNMMILHTLLPNAGLTGVEINHDAADKLAELPYVRAVESSIYQFPVTEQYDLVFTKGVAMFQDEAVLDDFYEIVYSFSKRYIMFCEYYNPTPTEIPYRGYKLFKRDYAGELMDRYPDVKLVDYGFQYHRDSLFPVDDFTWFVLEKR